MNNSTIFLSSSSDMTLVHWAFNRDHAFIQDVKFNTIKIVTSQFKLLDRVGFLIGQNVLWVELDSINDIDAYAYWLNRYHEIIGVVFSELDDAKKFKEILEKKYVWHILQT